MAGLLSAGALALVLIVGTSGPAQASAIPPSGDGWAELFLPYLSNTECLDVPGGSTSPGVNDQMFHCHGYASNGAPQRWVFAELSDGSYQIRNASSHLCLTPDPAADLTAYPLAVVKQLPCGSYGDQWWTLVDDPNYPDLRFMLRNLTHTNECLYSYAADHASVDVAACAYTPYQVWQFG